MTSEKEKMLNGQLYYPYDTQLIKERSRARALFKAYNETAEGQEKERVRLISELLGLAGSEIVIEPPFYCDYGYNIEVGSKVFFNFNCIILDVAKVRIGDRVLFGPMVQVYTATHPLSAEERRKELESAKPITIGDDVWLGGGAIINPGVSIGPGSVIGSGSVVTADIPEGVFAAGNPCRVLREIT